MTVVSHWLNFLAVPLGRVYQQARWFFANRSTAAEAASLAPGSSSPAMKLNSLGTDAAPDIALGAGLAEMRNTEPWPPITNQPHLGWPFLFQPFHS